MANFDVIVNAVDKTRGTFQGIERSLQGINGLAAKVGAALAGAFTVQQVVQAASAYQKLQTSITGAVGAANSLEVFQRLNTQAAELGVTVDDLTGAFKILSSVGIDSSAASLEEYARIAAGTGSTVEQIADAFGNVFQGSFGKIGKATNDLIEVEEKYGQFVVRIGGVVAGSVNSTGQVVDLLRKYARENQNYTDALKVQSNSIDASFKRLGISVNSAFADSGLATEISSILDKISKLLTEGGNLNTIFSILAKALRFLDDNFKTIVTTLSILVGGGGLLLLGGRLVAVAKFLYSAALGANRWASSITRASSSLSPLISGITGFTKASGGFITFTAAISRTVKNAFAIISGSTIRALLNFGLFRGGVIAAVSTLTVFGSTLLKLGGIALRFLGGPWGLLIAGVIAFSDEIVAAGRSVLEFFGILDKTPEFKITVGTPTGAGPRSDLINKPDGAQAPITPSGTPAGKPADTFLADLLGGFSQARTELNQLQTAIAKTTDINIVAKLFEEASSRAEQFGIVLQKSDQLIRRDFVLSVEKSAEALRIQQQEFADAATTLRQFSVELDSEALALDRQALSLVDSALLTKMFANEVQAAENALSLNAERLVRTSTNLKLYNIELEQNSISLELQQQRLGNSAQQARKFAQELTSNSIALTENAQRLADTNFQAGKFAQELTAGSQALTENAQRLADVNLQAGLFNQSIASSRQSTESQRITLELLNAAYQSGTVTQTEYADALGSVNQRLLGVTERTALLNEQYRTNSQNTELNTQLLATLTAQYEAGTIGLTEYTQRLSLLSYQYENLTSVTAKALKTSRDEVRTQDLSALATRDLTTQLRTGAISWREYGAAISKLDSAGVAQSFINTTREIERAKSMAEVFAETLEGSVRRAGDTLASSLTEGIQKGKLSLRSFKDFFGNILNDISAMIIQRNFVSPIVDALTGSMGRSGSGGGFLGDIVGSLGKSFLGGGGGGGFGDIFGSIGDFFGNILPFAEGGIVTSPVMGLVGEAGAEAIIPLDRLEDLMGGGGTQVVNFTINAIDTQTGIEFLLKNKPQIIGMVQQGFNSQGKTGIYR